MEKAQIEIIERKVIDNKTVTSKMKYGKITIYVKSIFNGDKHIDDILFSMAKERINNEKIS